MAAAAKARKIRRLRECVFPRNRFWKYLESNLPRGRLGPPDLSIAATVKGEDRQKKAGVSLHIEERAGTAARPRALAGHSDQPVLENFLLSDKTIFGQ
jgi:hypothetical protein